MAAVDQLAVGIGRNTSLHRVAFHGCLLGSADFKVLTDALRDNKTLKEVVISNQRTGSVNQALKQCNPNIAFELDLKFLQLSFSIDQMIVNFVSFMDHVH